MMPTSLARQRGVALLVALLALSIVSLASVGIARSATNRSLDQRHSLRRVQDRLIVDALKPLLLGWVENRFAIVLEEESHRISWMTLLDEQREGLRVSVERLDLSGRLHYSHLGSRTARRGLPMELAGLDRAQPLKEHEKELPPPLLEELVDGGSDVGLLVFPDESESGPAICEWVTTAGSGALNVNACPTPLLEAALEAIDPAFARRLLAIRERNELISPNLVRTRAARPTAAREQAIPLTASSDAFGFHITVESTGRASTFWIVTELDQSSERSSAWKITECRRVDR